MKCFFKNFKLYTLQYKNLNKKMFFTEWMFKILIKYIITKSWLNNLHPWNKGFKFNILNRITVQLNQKNNNYVCSSYF